MVRRDEERTLLDGLPVRRLWGIGPVAEEKLHRLGIDTVGAFAALSDAEVADILGGTVGPALHRLAKGIDDRPVAERAGAKQISAESTFAEDLTTLDQLRDATGPIGEHAHRRLRARRPRRPHRDRQAQEVRHEHAHQIRDAAVRHRPTPRR